MVSSTYPARDNDSNSNMDISAVVNNQLCTACGGCLAVCPVDSIRSFETAGGHLKFKIDNAKCVKCGLCYKICPGAGFSDVVLNMMPEDPFVGTICETWVGKSKDKRVYLNSQSGGIATSLLLAAIKSGDIGGAVVVTMGMGNPPRPKVCIATTEEEIVQAQKSKYCPVPLLSVVKQLMDIDYPVALVGLPCHLHGLENIISIYPELKEKVKYRIGLICDRVMTYGAIDYLIDKAGYKGKNETEITYRDKEVSGYPGDVKISMQNKFTVLPAKERMRIKEYFTPVRCRLCFDKLNFLADIVIGDPHGIEGVDRQYGESLIFVRNANGQRILRDTELAEGVEIRKINMPEAIAGQNVEKKRADWLGYCQQWENRNNILPNFAGKLKHTFGSCEAKEQYCSHMEFSLTLEKCNSREELLKSIQRKIYSRNLLKKILYMVKSFVENIRTSMR